MINYIANIADILTKTRYALVFFLLLIIFAIVFAITANIVIFPSDFSPSFDLNPIIEPINLVLISVIIFLVALNFIVMLHN